MDRQGQKRRDHLGMRKRQRAPGRQADHCSLRKVYQGGFVSGATDGSMPVGSVLSIYINIISSIISESPRHEESFPFASPPPRTLESFALNACSPAVPIASIIHTRLEALAPCATNRSPRAMLCLACTALLIPPTASRSSESLLSKQMDQRASTSPNYQLPRGAVPPPLGYVQTRFLGHNDLRASASP